MLVELLTPNQELERPYLQSMYTLAQILSVLLCTYGRQWPHRLPFRAYQLNLV